MTLRSSSKKGAGRQGWNGAEEAREKLGRGVPAGYESLFEMFDDPATINTILTYAGPSKTFLAVDKGIRQAQGL